MSVLRTRTPIRIRAIAALAAAAFLLQDVAFAMPELAARAGVPHVPASAAMIEDRFDAGHSGGKTVFLIQDAHTNASGQRHIARTLEALHNQTGFTHVFLEAGSGDDSIGFLRPLAGSADRRNVAEPYLNKGLLQGAEYFELVTDRPVKLWGVEDPALYAQALAAYRTVALGRSVHEARIGRLDTAVEVLKHKIYNPALLELDRILLSDVRESKPFTELLAELDPFLKRASLGWGEFPELAAVHRALAMERKIDFDLVRLEEAEAIHRLPEADRAAIEAVRSSAGRIAGSNLAVQASHAALLKEALAAAPGPARSVPAELRKYFEYIEATQAIRTERAVREQERLTQALISRLTRTREEAGLVRAASALEAFRGLGALELTPDRYKSESANPYFADVARFEGFLNGQWMRLGTGYEKVVFLDPAFEDWIAEAKRFYDLTLARDRQMIREALLRMDEAGERKAVLVAGGYHAPNLKRLLRESGVSYVSILPQITHPTDKARYERLLLAQTPGRPAGSARAMSLKPSREANPALLEQIARDLASRPGASPEALRAVLSELSGGARLAASSQSVRTGVEAFADSIVDKLRRDPLFDFADFSSEAQTLFGSRTDRIPALEILAQRINRTLMEDRSLMPFEKARLYQFLADLSLNDREQSESVFGTDIFYGAYKRMMGTRRYLIERNRQLLAAFRSVMLPVLEKVKRPSGPVYSGNKVTAEVSARFDALHHGVGKDLFVYASVPDEKSVLNFTVDPDAGPAFRIVVRPSERRGVSVANFRYQHPDQKDAAPDVTRLEADDADGIRELKSDPQFNHVMAALSAAGLTSHRAGEEQVLSSIKSIYGMSPWEGIEIEIHSRLPVSSALGGGTGMTSALIAALLEYTGRGKAVSKAELALLGSYAEMLLAVDDPSSPMGGWQDALGALLTYLNWITIGSDRPFTELHEQAIFEGEVQIRREQQLMSSLLARSVPILLPSAEGTGSQDVLEELVSLHLRGSRRSREAAAAGRVRMEQAWDLISRYRSGDLTLESATDGLIRLMTEEAEAFGSLVLGVRHEGFDRLLSELTSARDLKNPDGTPLVSGGKIGGAGSRGVALVFLAAGNDRELSVRRRRVLDAAERAGMSSFPLRAGDGLRLKSAPVRRTQGARLTSAVSLRGLAPEVELEVLKHHRDELKKERFAPGTGNFTRVYLFSDIHGSIGKMDDFILKALKDAFPEAFGSIARLDPSISLQEQLAEPVRQVGGWNVIREKVAFLNGGDLMDRQDINKGESGLAVYERTIQLQELGLQEFTTGNHDHLVIMPLMGLHLPTYEGYRFYLDMTEAGKAAQRALEHEIYRDPARPDSKLKLRPVEDVVRERNRGFASDRDRTEFWSQKFSDYYTERIDPASPLVREWKQIGSEVLGDPASGSAPLMSKDQIKGLSGLQKVFWNKFTGKNMEDVDIYTGIRTIKVGDQEVCSTGLMSAMWWRELRTNFQQQLDKPLDAKDAIRDLSIRASWEKAIRYMDRILEGLEADLRKRRSEGQWWVRAIEALYNQNYYTAEQAAWDWVVHLGWGPALFEEINRLIRAGKIPGPEIDRSNFLLNSKIQEMSRRMQEMFALYSRNRYMTFLHATLPMDRATDSAPGDSAPILPGQFRFRYDGVTYVGAGHEASGSPSVWEGMDRLERAVREADPVHMSDAATAFNAIYDWYSDFKTRAKPRDVLELVNDDIAFTNFFNLNGIYGFLGTGHNPLPTGFAKYVREMLRRFAGVLTQAFGPRFRDYWLQLDAGVSLKFGNQGLMIAIHPADIAGGLRIFGYTKPDAKELTENPAIYYEKTYKNYKEQKKSDAETPEPNPAFTTEPVGHEDFLLGHLGIVEDRIRVLESRLRSQVEADGPGGARLAENLPEYKRTISRQLTGAMGQLSKLAQELENVKAEIARMRGYEPDPDGPEAPEEPGMNRAIIDYFLGGDLASRTDRLQDFADRIEYVREQISAASMPLLLDHPSREDLLGALADLSSAWKTLADLQNSLADRQASLMPVHHPIKYASSNLRVSILAIIRHYSELEPAVEDFVYYRDVMRLIRKGSGNVVRSMNLAERAGDWPWSRFESDEEFEAFCEQFEIRWVTLTGSPHPFDAVIQPAPSGNGMTDAVDELFSMQGEFEIAMREMPEFKDQPVASDIESDLRQMREWIELKEAVRPLQHQLNAKMAAYYIEKSMDLIDSKGAVRAGIFNVLTSDPRFAAGDRDFIHDELLFAPDSIDGRNLTDSDLTRRVLSHPALASVDPLRAKVVWHLFKAWTAWVGVRGPRGELVAQGFWDEIVALDRVDTIASVPWLAVYEERIAWAIREVSGNPALFLGPLTDSEYPSVEGRAAAAMDLADLLTAEPTSESEGEGMLVRAKRAVRMLHSAFGARLAADRVRPGQSEQRLNPAPREFRMARKLLKLVQNSDLEGMDKYVKTQALLAALYGGEAIIWHRNKQTGKWQRNIFRFSNGLLYTLPFSAMETVRSMRAGEDVRGSLLELLAPRDRDRNIYNHWKGLAEPVPAEAGGWTGKATEQNLTELILEISEEAAKYGIRPEHFATLAVDPDFQNPFLHTFIGIPAESHVFEQGASRLEMAATVMRLSPEDRSKFVRLENHFEPEILIEVADVPKNVTVIRDRHQVGDPKPGKGGIRFISAGQLSRDRDFMERFEKLKASGFNLDELRFFLRKWVREEVRALAIGMSVKNAVADLPFSGAKGTVLFADVEQSPKKGPVIQDLFAGMNASEDGGVSPAQRYKASVLRRFVDAMYDAGVLGPDDDVPAPDLGSTSADMDIMTDALLRRYLGLGIRQPYAETVHVLAGLRSSGHYPAELLDRIEEMVRSHRSNMDALMVRPVLLEIVAGYLKEAMAAGVKIKPGTPFGNLARLPATFTAKSEANLGSGYRSRATGEGVQEIAKTFYIEDHPEKSDSASPMDGVTVKIEGAGAVGLEAAIAAVRDGAKVISMKEATGTAFKSRGFTIEDLEKMRRVLQRNQDGSAVHPEGFALLDAKTAAASEFTIDGAFVLAGSDAQDAFLTEPAVFFYACAMENSINGTNVHALNADYIVEGANGAITNEAYWHLIEQGRTVLPDSLANAGGVTGSTWEWQANRDLVRHTAASERKMTLGQLTAAALRLRKIQNRWINSAGDPLDLRTATMIVLLERGFKGGPAAARLASQSIRTFEREVALVRDGVKANLVMQFAVPDRKDLVRRASLSIEVVQDPGSTPAPAMLQLPIAERPAILLSRIEDYIHELSQSRELLDDIGGLQREVALKFSRIVTADTMRDEMQLLNSAEAKAARATDDEDIRSVIRILQSAKRRFNDPEDEKFHGNYTGYINEVRRALDLLEPMGFNPHGPFGSDLGTADDPLETLGRAVVQFLQIAEGGDASDGARLAIWDRWFGGERNSGNRPSSQSVIEHNLQAIERLVQTAVIPSFDRQMKRLYWRGETHLIPLSAPAFEGIVDGPEASFQIHAVHVDADGRILPSGEVEGSVRTILDLTDHMRLRARSKSPNFLATIHQFNRSGSKPLYERLRVMRQDFLQSRRGREVRDLEMTRGSGWLLGERAAVILEKLQDGAVRIGVYTDSRMPVRPAGSVDEDSDAPAVEWDAHIPFNQVRKTDLRSYEFVWKRANGSVQSDPEAIYLNDGDVRLWIKSVDPGLGGITLSYQAPVRLRQRRISQTDIPSKSGSRLAKAGQYRARYLFEPAAVKQVQSPVTEQSLSPTRPSGRYERHRLRSAQIPSALRTVIENGDLERFGSGVFAAQPAAFESDTDFAMLLDEKDPVIIRASYDSSADILSLWALTSDENPILLHQIRNPRRAFVEDARRSAAVSLSMSDVQMTIEALHASLDALMPVSRSEDAAAPAKVRNRILEYTLDSWFDPEHPEDFDVVVPLLVQEALSARRALENQVAFTLKGREDLAVRVLAAASAAGAGDLFYSSEEDLKRRLPGFDSDDVVTVRVQSSDDPRPAAPVNGEAADVRTIAVQPLRRSQDNRIGVPAIKLVTRLAIFLADAEKTPEFRDRLRRIIRLSTGQDASDAEIDALIDGTASAELLKKLSVRPILTVPISAYLRVMQMTARMAEASA